MTDKYIKIMADYSSTGLWDRDGMMLELDEVPLPFWWVPKFKRWTEWYEENDDYMEDSIVDFQYQKFAAAGEDLATQLAKVLPDWQIWYFNEHMFIEAMNNSKNPVESTYLRKIDP